MFLNVGLTNDHVEIVCAALHLVNRSDLSHFFLTCNELQTVLLNLLLEEMFSTKSDMVYWERFRKGSYWEILLSRMNSQVCNLVFPRIDNVETLFTDPTDLVHYIESLRADFDSLAVFLAKLNNAGSHLKKLYNEIHKRSVFQDTVRTSLIVARNNSQFDDTLHIDVDEPPLWTRSERTARDVCSLTETLLTEFFVDITQAINEHMPKLKLMDKVPYCDKQDLQYASTNDIQISATRVMDLLLNHPCFDTGFPLGITHLKVRRPSYMERYWVRNILVTIAGLYFANTTIRMVQSGELQSQCKRLFILVQNKVQERVIEPVSDLASELFDTIRKRDDIVSRKDLEASRAALHRMLVEFADSKEGYNLIFNRFGEELLKQGDNLLKTIYSSPTAGESTGGNTAVVDKHTFRPTPEQAWDVLMSEYEKELQTPIRGMLYGNLFTAMLIQMQKLKVHTEGAMLTMDQILASNELTIAATAAMPALVAFGLGISWIRNLFQPKAQTPGVHTLHFRLILNDVERSLVTWQARKEEMTRASAVSVSLGDGAEKIDDNNNDVDADNSEYERSILERSVYQAKGVYTFHMARLRSKFHEMFDIRSPNSEVRAVRSGGSIGHLEQRRGRRRPPRSESTAGEVERSTTSTSTAGIMLVPLLSPSRTSTASNKQQLEKEDHQLKAFKEIRKKLSEKIDSYHANDSLTPSVSVSYIFSWMNPFQWPWKIAALNRQLWTWISDIAFGRRVLLQPANVRPTLYRQVSFEEVEVPSPDSAASPLSPFKMPKLPNEDDVVNKINTGLVVAARGLWRGYKFAWNILESTEDLIVSAHWLLWGNNAEYQSNTNIYNSLDADILALESNESDVSVEQKIQLIHSMRMSYKCLSPVN